MLVVVSLLRDGLALELLTSVGDLEVVLVPDLGRPHARPRVGLGRGPPSGHGSALIYLQPIQQNTTNLKVVRQKIIFPDRLER